MVWQSCNGTMVDTYLVE
ncbi:hypothetical protein B4U80_06671 [Leptotrombidium deliense]|uniref:Uncharacterized protein n=1 Tax=Leptotrombidium deliense TaxID=299467 RepID=A0A443RTI6_9ACAR|nr:hypothetical protein B4U80_06671 [Leptotrombidium deliense]